MLIVGDNEVLVVSTKTAILSGPWVTQGPMHFHLTLPDKNTSSIGMVGMERA